MTRWLAWKAAGRAANSALILLAGNGALKVSGLARLRARAVTEDDPGRQPGRGPVRPDFRPGLGSGRFHWRLRHAQKQPICRAVNLSPVGSGGRDSGSTG